MEQIALCNLRPLPQLPGPLNMQSQLAISLSVLEVVEPVGIAVTTGDKAGAAVKYLPEQGLISQRILRSQSRLLQLLGELVTVDKGAGSMVVHPFLDRSPQEAVKHHSTA
jgi:hypothetical protein